MAVDTGLEAEISELEAMLSQRVEAHPPLVLSPAWFQQRLLDWATNDPDFRVKLLRFVDVLPTLRSTRAVADHVRQYFREAPPLIETASEIASTPVFRPILSQVVREGVFAMAHRFIAGETPSAAIPALRELARDGVAWTVDLLGEETLSDAEADAFLARYLDLVRTLSERVSEKGDGDSRSPAVNVSIKLSALCPNLEPAAPDFISSAARERLRPLLRMAIERVAFINVDMEQYRNKDIVHCVVTDLLLEPEFASYPNVGIVVQAYLRDAADDIVRVRALAERRGAPITVRLVKGAYWDEERIVAEQNSWPVPVWERKDETDDSYERCTDALLAAWPHLRPAYGTHNPRSVAQAVVKSRAAGLADEDIEFQMLYGMAEGLREAVAAAGFLTRVYVPVGAVIPGMAYLVRRLLENTSNQAWFNAGAAGVAETSVAASGSSLERHARSDLPVAATQESVFVNAPPLRFFEPEVRKKMGTALKAVRSSFGAEYPLLVNGRRVTDRKHATVAYPAEPSVIVGSVAQATEDDVDAAVRSAHAAYPGWRDTPAEYRAERLRKAAAIMEARRYELAATMVFESAKPWHEADGDVCEAIDYLRYYALQGERLTKPVAIEAVPGEHSEYFYQGRGVTAVIAPWNFPLAIITGMSSAALAAGNPVILKPAAQSPIIAHHLVEILHEAGIPENVVQYLPGPGAAIGQTLVEHPGVSNIAFTGSNAVGLGIMAAAAGVRLKSDPRGVAYRPVIKRVVAELGGKNAIIIDDDADLDQGIHGAVVSAFGFAGQKCSACSRLVIVGSAYDEAVARLKNAVESLIVGPPHEPQTFVPPVISGGARDKIMGYIDAGKSYATLLTQGERRDGDGSYVPPTVFTDVPPDSALAQDEIFGPVLGVFRATNFEEALEIAMNSAYALTGGVFSRNPRHVAQARRRFRVGNLYINRKITGAVVGRQPFGGRLMSGAGEKAGGPDYLRQFMDPRVVTENTVRRGFAPEEHAN